MPKRPYNNRILYKLFPIKGTTTITSIKSGKENQKSQKRMVTASIFPPKYADIVPTASPPRVLIITGNVAAVSAVLAPQINLPRRSNPYFVVPNGCSADGPRNGVSKGKSGGVKFSIVNGVNHPNDLLLDCIFPISNSVASNSGSRHPGIR